MDNFKKLEKTLKDLNTFKEKLEYIMGQEYYFSLNNNYGIEITNIKENGSCSTINIYKNNTFSFTADFSGLQKEKIKKLFKIKELKRKDIESNLINYLQSGTNYMTKCQNFPDIKIGSPSCRSCNYFIEKDNRMLTVNCLKGKENNEK